ncbi:LacI family DNA-binding transcriptional regulator [Plantactinospora siamensis]|uniref:LacI family DNA-binding transcriptional regulator n=1 Tax=Plantactinospora siamensis TaxID=555372 RepID=A0ABV6NTQ4_9ACTN
MPEKVTIATVARHAQVSRQTVSNVLNSPHLVREETRERVRDAIATLGYRVSQAARQMRTGRSKLLAARIEPTRDGINGSVLDRFLHGLTETAEAAGYRVLLYTAGDRAAEIAAYDDLLGAYDLDGFVLTGTDHGDVRTAWLAERGVPFVTFGRPWDSPERHPWVDVDGAAGAAQATRHLIGAGHRRIAFVGWPAGSGVGDDRRSGWLAALREADLPYADELDRRTVDGITEGAAVTRDLLALAEPPTALVCASDSLAIGALQAARTYPPNGRDLAVTGFDDTPVAQAIGLTSVSQPLGQAAARCIELLTALLDGDVSGGPRAAGQPPSQVLLRPSLVIRQPA